jgi:hypothetical protein
MNDSTVMNDVVVTKDENGRKRTYDIKKNESGRFEIFLHLAIKEYKKWLKMVVKPIETDKFSC